MSVFITILATFLFTSYVPTASAQDAKGTSMLTAELRLKLLKSTPKDLGLENPTATKPVFGVLMETGYPNAVATLMALNSGDTSLYFSTGGGVIGGGQHVSVAKASKRFVTVANDYLTELKPVSSFPQPTQNTVVFYLLTSRGVLTAIAPVDDLGKKRHPLAGLFYEGHKVMTELRLATERQAAR